MVKIKVIAVDSTRAHDPNHEDKQLGPVEDFIEQIGYQNIKEIRIQSASASLGYYHIFYEDGQPYTSRTAPQKKGLFG